jgi:divalent metal cation (Fe/Co/Zn/Cd) transporter
VRSKSFSRAEAAMKIIEDIESMDSELQRIKILISQESELTITEAKKILSEQTQTMADYNKIIDEKEDNIEEHIWTVEDLEIEVNQLKSDKDKITKIADEAVKLNQERDTSIEQEYYM